MQTTSAKATASCTNAIHRGLAGWHVEGGGTGGGVSVRSPGGLPGGSHSQSSSFSYQEGCSPLFERPTTKHDRSLRYLAPKCRAAVSGAPGLLSGLEIHCDGKCTAVPLPPQQLCGMASISPRLIVHAMPNLIVLLLAAFVLAPQCLADETHWLPVHGKVVIAGVALTAPAEHVRPQLVPPGASGANPPCPVCPLQKARHSARQK